MVCGVEPDIVKQADSTLENRQKLQENILSKAGSTAQPLKDTLSLSVTGSKIAVSVKSDGEHLRPYAIKPADNKRSVSAHIASTAGKVSKHASTRCS
jgi:uncharacterized protein YfaP (DUF2135 family)